MNISFYGIEERCVLRFKFHRPFQVGLSPSAISDKTTKRLFKEGRPVSKSPIQLYCDNVVIFKGWNEHLVSKPLS